MAAEAAEFLRESPVRGILFQDKQKITEEFWK